MIRTIRELLTFRRAPKINGAYLLSLAISVALALLVGAGIMWASGHDPIAGYAVLLVSADLDEVFRLSDRIITMFEGRVTGSFRAGEINKQEIGYYMTGARDKEADA